MENKKPDKNQGNFFTRLLGGIDNWQQRHRFAGFPYAVVKKYGDDQSGYQAALVTYYGFLSLFPLLLVATSVIDLISRGNEALRSRLTDSIGHYFPAVSDQLQSSVLSKTATGITLAISLLFTLYGAKGVADAVRHALDHAWEVPRSERSGFPKNTLKSLILIIGGGLGLIVSAVLSGIATSTFGHTWYLRVLPYFLGAGINYLVFLFVFQTGTSKKHRLADIRLGAIMAAIALLILQVAGGYLVTHQLHNAKGTYGQFGLVLAILFWIYLQAQVFMYTVQVNVVHTLKLWPRSLTGSPLTTADRKALTLYIKREKQQEPPEEVHVSFQGKS